MIELSMSMKVISTRVRQALGLHFLRHGLEVRIYCGSSDPLLFFFFLSSSSGSQYVWEC